MNQATDNTSTEPAGADWRAKAGILLLTASAVTSTWLALHAGRPSAGCGTSCGDVLGSVWSHVGPLPVAAVGAVLYAVLAAGCRLRVQRTQPGRWALRTAGAAVWVGAAYFLCLQIFVLKAFCPWCLAVHAVAAGGWALLRPSLAGVPDEEEVEERWISRAAAAVGVAAMGLLQLWLNPASGPAEPRVARLAPNEAAVRSSAMEGTVSLHGGAVSFPAAGLPLFGKATAPHAIVAVLDYTCPHCRDLHELLEKLPSALQDHACVLVAPGFRDHESREIQRLMLTLHLAAPAVHAELDRELSAGRLPASAALVKAEAEQRLGTMKALATAVEKHRAAVDAVLAATEKLMRLNEAITGENVLPQVIIGTQVVAGAWSEPGHYLQLAVTEFKLPAGVLAGLPPKGLASMSALSLGSLAPGETRRVNLPYRNVGGQPLTPMLLSFIGPARTLPFERRAVGSGQTSFIPAEVTAPATAGTFTIRASLQSEETAQPVEWVVTGTVDAKSTPVPATPVFTHSSTSAPQPELLETLRQAEASR